MIDSHFDPQLANLSHASAMAFQAHLIFILKLVVAVSSCNIALKECEADNSSKLGFVLVGYAFKSLTTEDLAFCFSVCNTDPSCQSLNYNLRIEFRIKKKSAGQFSRGRISCLL